VHHSPRLVPLTLILLEDSILFRFAAFTRAVVSIVRIFCAFFFDRLFSYTGRHQQVVLIPAHGPEISPPPISSPAFPTHVRTAHTPFYSSGAAFWSPLLLVGLHSMETRHLLVPYTG